MKTNDPQFPAARALHEAGHAMIAYLLRRQLDPMVTFSVDPQRRFREPYAELFASLRGASLPHEICTFQGSDEAAFAQIYAGGPAAFRVFFGQRRLPENAADNRMVGDLVQRLLPAGANYELYYQRLLLSETAKRALTAARPRGCSNRQLVLGLAEQLTRSGTMNGANVFAAIDEMLANWPPARAGPGSSRRAAGPPRRRRSAARPGSARLR